MQAKRAGEERRGVQGPQPRKLPRKVPRNLPRHLPRNLPRNLPRRKKEFVSQSFTRNPKPAKYGIIRGT